MALANKPGMRLAMAGACLVALSASLHAQTAPTPPANGQNMPPPPPGGFPPGGPPPGGFPPGGPPPGGFPPGGPPGGGPPGPGGFGPPPTPEQLAAKMKEIYDEKAPRPRVALPAPSADLKVLEGTWIGKQMPRLRYTEDKDGKPIQMTAEGQRVFDRRVKATYVDRVPLANAGALCMPAGSIWQVGVLYPFALYQNKTSLTLVGSELHTVWNIRIDGQHRTSGPAEYMGDSIGHWEGDTLVVDTTNFKAPLWIDADGHPASTTAHILQRFRRTDGGNVLEIVSTIDDPKYYTAPWTIVHTFEWRPDMEFFSEYDCETQLGGAQAAERFGLQADAEAK